MIKNIIKSTMVVVVAIFAGYNMYQSNQETQVLSDVMLENIEALANDESNVVKPCPLKGGTCIVLIGDSTIVGAKGWQPY